MSPLATLYQAHVFTTLQPNVPDITHLQRNATVLESEKMSNRYYHKYFRKNSVNKGHNISHRNW